MTTTPHHVISKYTHHRNQKYADIWIRRGNNLIRSLASRSRCPVMSSAPPMKKPTIAGISSAQQNDIFFASQNRERLLPVKRPSRKNLCLPKRAPAAFSTDTNEDLQNKRQKVERLDILNDIAKDGLDTPTKKGRYRIMYLPRQYSYHQRIA